MYLKGKLYESVFFLLIAVTLLSCGNTGSETKEENLIIKKIDSLVETNKDSVSKNYLKELAQLREVAENEEYKNALIKVNLGMVNFYNNTGRFDKAIKLELEILELRKSLGDTLNTLNSLINIANTYATLKQPANQKKYLDIIEQFPSQKFSEVNQIRYQINKGLFFMLEKDYPKAKQCFSNSLSLSDKFKNKDYQSFALFNYGATLLEEGNDSAIYFLKACIPVYQHHHNYVGLGGIYNNIAEAYWIKNERRDSILWYLNEGSRLARRYGGPLELQSLLSNLSYYYEENSDYKKSNAYLKEQDSLKKGGFNQELAKGISAIEQDYSLQLSKSENEKLSAELKQKNTLRNSAIAGCVLLAILGFYLWTTLKQRKLLFAKEQTIKEQEIDRLLAEKDIKNLDTLIEGREHERKRIGRDLHDRLGSMLSTVKLQFSTLEESLGEKGTTQNHQYHSAIELLDEAVKEVRKIAHDLVTGTLVKNGLLAALQETKNNIEQTGQIKIRIYEKGVQPNLPLDLEVGLYRVVQELLSNVLKHAKASQVNIHLVQEGRALTLVFEDNGIGFVTSGLQKGIGLANVRQRIAALGGVVSFDSRPGSGSTTIIEINLD